MLLRPQFSILDKMALCARYLVLGFTEFVLVICSLLSKQYCDSYSPNNILLLRIRSISYYLRPMASTIEPILVSNQYFLGFQPFSYYRFYYTREADIFVGMLGTTIARAKWVRGHTLNHYREHQVRRLTRRVVYRTFHCLVFLAHQTDYDQPGFAR